MNPVVVDKWLQPWGNVEVFDIARGCAGDLCGHKRLGAGFRFQALYAPAGRAAEVCAVVQRILSRKRLMERHSSINEDIISIGFNTAVLFIWVCAFFML